MELSAIFSITNNGFIGIKNRIPVRTPSEIKRLNILTRNKPLIMGRKTHESIGCCLEGRPNIVLSRNKNYQGFPGSIIINNVYDAYQCAASKNAFGFVIGGGEIFKEFLPYYKKFYMTLLDYDINGDVKFPVSLEEILKLPNRLAIQSKKSEQCCISSKFYICHIPEEVSLL